MVATGDALEKDVVVVGSGAGAMTAAIVAASAGLDVLVVEKTRYFGGTSAISGGTAWIPANKYMTPADGIESREKALQYIENVTGGRYFRPAHAAALVDHGKAMVDYLEKHTEMKFTTGTHPDYHTDLPGSVNHGRSIDTVQFDGALLGPYLHLLRPGLPEHLVLGGMMVDGADIRHLVNQLHSFKSFMYVVRLVARYYWSRLRHGRDTRLVYGNAMIGRMLKSAIDLKVTLWNNSPGRRLVVENGRVTGVVVEHEGKEVTVKVKKGAVIGTGGFSHDMELKKRFYPHPEQHESLCPDGNTGDGIKMAVAAGAHFGGDLYQNFLGTQTKLMRDASGKIVSKIPAIRRDRVKPGFICVNRKGLRFVNEADPYNTFAHAQTRAEDAVPTFMICDHKHLRRYGLGLVRPGPAWLRPLGGFIEGGHLFRADTIEGLAALLGIDAAGLTDTVRKNNEYAKAGVDLDFGKGNSVYDRWEGDPSVKPNPNLGPIQDGPFYAVHIWPGDLGSFMGLETDPYGAVLGAVGKPIEGLYACGMDMHPAFGGGYPGGGSSLGPGMTFGYLAGLQLAGKFVESPEARSDSARGASVTSTSATSKSAASTLAA